MLQFVLVLRVFDRDGRAQINYIIMTYCIKDHYIIAVPDMLDECVR